MHYSHHLGSLVIVFILFALTACANNFRTGLHNLEKQNTPAALQQFEQSAKEGHRIPAILASELYISDYKIPRDLEKSKYYLELALNNEYGIYDQRWDYYIPLIKAYQILDDQEISDKSAAFDILNYEKYQEHSWPLSTRATCYLIGHGVEKDLNKATELFERAIEHQVWKRNGLYFAWWLSIYPDESFRNPERALTFVKEAMTDPDISNRPVPLSIFATTQAANNNFESAVALQTRALKILKEEIKLYPYLAKFEPTFEARLESFKQENPWILSQDDLDRCGYDSIRCLRNLSFTHHLPAQLKTDFAEKPF